MFLEGNQCFCLENGSLPFKKTELMYAWILMSFSKLLAERDKPEIFNFNFFIFELYLKK